VSEDTSCPYFDNNSEIVEDETFLLLNTVIKDSCSSGFSFDNIIATND
jgi:hypothetical protein